MIDINQPVKQGDDVVINEGGDQHLGSYEEFNLKAAEGLLTGVNMDADKAEAILEEDAPAEASAARDSKGKFIKVKELDMPEEVTPPVAEPVAAPVAPEAQPEVQPEAAPEAPVEAPAEAPAEAAPEAAPAE